MTRKLVRRLGILVAILVLLPVLVVTVAGLLLPKDVLKASIVRSVTAATGADVEMGDVSVRLWPSLGARLSGGAISGTGARLAEVTGSPNQLENFRLDLECFEVGLAIGPLLGGRIVVEEIRLRGPRLDVVWDKGDLIAQGYDLVLSQVTLPVAAVRAAAETAPRTGTPIGELIPRELAFLLRGRVDSLVLQELPLEKISLQGNFTERVLTVDSFAAKLSSGRLAGTATVDYRHDPWGTLEFTAEARDVPAAVMLAPWVPELAARLACDLVAEVSGTCGLRDGDTAKQTLGMTGTVASGEGVLSAADWLQEVTPYLGDRQDLKNIGFRSLDHHFRVDNGRYIVEEILIDGHDTHWRGTGWVGFNDTLEMSVTVKLPAGFTPDMGNLSFLAEALRDPQGRVNLGLTLQGRASKPTVGVDFGSLTGQGAGGASGGAKKGLSGLLDKWKTR